MSAVGVEYSICVSLRIDVDMSYNPIASLDHNRNREGCESIVDQAIGRWDERDEAGEKR